MEKIIELVIEFATTAGIKLILAIILLIAGLKLISIMSKFLSRTRWFNKIDPSAQTFIRSFAAIALKIILILTIAAILGVPMTSVVALLASAGLAIGLALQGALGNLAGGLMILIFKPFQVGHFIDTHSDAGIVQEINIFYTVLRTPDNRIITLPNGSLSNSAVINFSAEDKRRIDINFSTSYETDIELVKRPLLEIATEHPLALQDPEPFCRLREHGDSALVFVLRVWCNAVDYWPMYFDLMETVKKKFDERGISIPYPQMDVHLDK